MWLINVLNLFAGMGRIELPLMESCFVYVGLQHEETFKRAAEPLQNAQIYTFFVWEHAIHRTEHPCVVFLCIHTDWEQLSIVG